MMTLMHACHARKDKHSAITAQTNQENIVVASYLAQERRLATHVGTRQQHDWRMRASDSERGVDIAKGKRDMKQRLVITKCLT